MPHWGYSIRELDPERTAKASGRELRISPKAAREICATIKGMKVDDAIALLDEVTKLKRPIPFKRYNKKMPHRRGLQGWHAGRYPVKAAEAIIKILESLKANAEFKGLDTERLRIIHAAAHKGTKIRSYTPRAFGRSTPCFEQTTHVEIIAVEE